MTASRRAPFRVRRRYARLTLRVNVAIESPAGAIRGVATTLGAGGLFVPTADPLPDGTPVAVRFGLPGDAEELHLQARVAWSQATPEAGRTPGMGLELADPDARADLAARLERWADRRESSGSGAGGI